MKTQQSYGPHISVLLKECVFYLTQEVPKENRCFFADLTFGAGGHSTSILEQSENFKVYAVDQDPDAIENGKKLVDSKNLQERLYLIHENFEEFPKHIRTSAKQVFMENQGFQGILLDLGVSSHQFDSETRGFSFRHEAELDMRMDYKDGQRPTAAEIINEFREEKIEEILRKYGEERYSKKIASEIVALRKVDPIKTTKQLENIVFHAYPKSLRHGKIHPATRTFQALRLAVNQELEVLEQTLPELFNLLAPGGRLAVISFHSLEDRIVKWTFREIKDNLPEKAHILTKKPIVPTEEEINENSRARSAKLRVIERISI